MIPGSIHAGLTNFSWSAGKGAAFTPSSFELLLWEYQLTFQSWSHTNKHSCKFMWMVNKNWVGFRFDGTIMWTAPLILINPDYLWWKTPLTHLRWSSKYIWHHSGQRSLFDQQSIQQTENTFFLSTAYSGSIVCHY